MRAFLVMAVLALGLAGTASAKLGISLALSTRHPQRGEPVVAVLRSEERVDGACRLRLIAVAPGAHVSTAIAAFVAGGISVQGPRQVRLPSDCPVAPARVRAATRAHRPARMAWPSPLPACGALAARRPERVRAGLDVPVSSLALGDRALA